MADWWAGKRAGWTVDLSASSSAVQRAATMAAHLVAWTAETSVAPKVPPSAARMAVTTVDYLAGMRAVL
jgi:hypothetical protein